MRHAKVASMGPRQDAGEDQRLTCSHHHIVTTLQWGPGRMPGKTRAIKMRSKQEPAASMGPRQDAGEDSDQRNILHVARVRFNGAPAGCRGRHTSMVMPPEGPGSFNGAPAGCRGRLLTAHIRPSRRSDASMGPRQDAGEDHPGPTGKSCAGSRFNGAPAGCRGRPGCRRR